MTVLDYIKNKDASLSEKVARVQNVVAQKKCTIIEACKEIGLPASSYYNFKQRQAKKKPLKNGQDKVAPPIMLAPPRNDTLLAIVAVAKISALKAERRLKMILDICEEK